jgi:hypothetical protein
VREQLIREVQLAANDESGRRRGRPWDLPAVAALQSGSMLDPSVT